MSTPQAFTISSEALARFPAAIQRTIVDVVQSELEKARSNCIQVLASPPRAEPASAQEPRAPMDEAWQREATRFVHSIEGFLNSCPSVKRGPNFKANSKHILEDAFRRSQFLNKAECRIVAKAAGLSSQQVRTWFQNKRNRSSKKPSKATGKRPSPGHSSKSASRAIPSPLASVTTTASRAASCSTAGSNGFAYQAPPVETDLASGSKVILAVPHRIQEVGLAMQGGASHVLSLGPASYCPAVSDASSAGEAQLWFEDVVGRPGSPSLHTPTADWDWSKIHQSLWLQYAGPSAGVMWDPPQVQGDSWLPRDTAALAMAASNFIDFQEPATESK